MGVGGQYTWLSYSQLCSRLARTSRPVCLLGLILESRLAFEPGVSASQVLWACLKLDGSPFVEFLPGVRRVQSHCLTSLPASSAEITDTEIDVFSC